MDKNGFFLCVLCDIYLSEKKNKYPCIVCAKRRNSRKKSILIGIVRDQFLFTIIHIEMWQKKTIQNSNKHVIYIVSLKTKKKNNLGLKVRNFYKSFDFQKNITFFTLSS